MVFFTRMPNDDGLPKAVTYAQLCLAASQRERVASRRLALRDGIDAEAALRTTLAAVAGALTLAELLQSRIQSAAFIAGKLAQRRKEKSTARAAKAAAMLPDPAAWQAWFDGSSHPNPGRLGIGAVLRSPAGVVLEISRMAGHGDSNEAEFLALIAVLEAAVAAGAGCLVVQGDSQVVLNAMQDLTLLGNSDHLQAHADHARALAAQISDLTLRWIPRHKNAAADALSQRAIDLFQ